MNNSAILYLYDAKLTNPNGDPDEENRPRMDYEREINLVSDVRLKRYIRDYLLDQGMDLFVRKIDDKSLTAEARLAKLKDLTDEAILKQFIDVRLFGATMPVKGDNKTFIGPVQFNWGYSLNKVELLESSITSHFASGEGKEQGTIGKDYRVKYSIIAFSGVISGKRAEKTLLQDEDIILLDEAMVKAIPLQATRSKIGQYPRLYLRVEFNDAETILGDFRDYIGLEAKTESLRAINEFVISLDRLVDYLQLHQEAIKMIYYFADPQLELLLKGERKAIEEVFSGFTIREVK